MTNLYGNTNWLLLPLAPARMLEFQIYTIKTKWKSYVFKKPEHVTKVHNYNEYWRVHKLRGVSAA